MTGRILATAIAALWMAPASAATLDFSGPICVGGLGGACASGFFIDQSYGDIAGQVDVQWDGDSATAGLQNAHYWAYGYETLTDVAYSGANSTLTIMFTALAGFGVSLTGFDIANYANRALSTTVVVTDMATNTVLFDSGTFTPENDCPADVCSFSSTLWTSNTGISLAFGPDSYNTGIDNITYDTYSIAAVPVPASGLLLLGGLFGLSRVRRRKS